LVQQHCCEPAARRAHYLFDTVKSLPDEADAMAASIMGSSELHEPREPPPVLSGDGFAGNALPRTDGEEDSGGAFASNRCRRSRTSSLRPPSCPPSSRTSRASRRPSRPPSRSRASRRPSLGRVREPEPQVEPPPAELPHVEPPRAREEYVIGEPELAHAPPRARRAKQQTAQTAPRHRFKMAGHSFLLCPPLFKQQVWKIDQMNF
jgi:hypothetical protein